MRLYRYSIVKKIGNASIKHKELQQYFNSNWSDQGFGRTLVKYRYQLSIYYTDLDIKLTKRTFDKKVLLQEV